MNSVRVPAAQHGRDRSLRIFDNATHEDYGSRPPQRPLTGTRS